MLAYAQPPQHVPTMKSDQVAACTRGNMIQCVRDAQSDEYCHCTFELRGFHKNCRQDPGQTLTSVLIAPGIDDLPRAIRLDVHEILRIDTAQKEMRNYKRRQYRKQQREEKANSSHATDQ